MGLKFKKITAIILTVSIMLLYSVPKLYAFADNTSTPTPSPTSSPAPTTVDNTATVSNTSSSGSNTGNNSINPSPTPSPSSTPDPSVSPTPTPDPSSGPTPTPDPSSSPTPTPDPSSGLNASNSAIVTNTGSSTTLTGDNTITATGSGRTATDSASTNSSQNSSTNTSVNTGNAVSATATDNTVNTTSVNSQVVYQTINIFVTQNGDINLSDPFTIAANAVQSYPGEPVINVSATTVNNYAYLSNDLVSFANTGNNVVNGATESAIINTGNAYSVVSLVNKVNFTVVNSEIHVITINLFGQLNGNIILPSLSQSSNCANCGVNMNVNNNASVNNNINSSAVTGQNTATGSASINTGNATSAVNTLNIVNTNLVGVNAQVLYINDYGSWNGNFIGWGNLAPQSGGATLVFYSLGPNNTSLCASCSAQTNVNNTAIVNNNISSFANTGGNSLLGNGFILTGNAYSAISLINFINSTFINSVGFFGFINIFGNWTGNIGGEKEFAAQNQNQSNIVETSSTNSQTMESGGMLSVAQSNNTGSFVKPGDTVTFFIDVKNTGTGTVYGANLDLYLMRNGVPAGGASYNLGDIPAGQGVKVSTGIVLSPNTPAGIYTARALAYGKVGPNSATVTGFADSFFTVLGGGFVSNALLSSNTNPPKNNQQVLGAQYPSVLKNDSHSNDYGPLYAFVTVIMAYIALRGFRQRDKFITIFGKKITLEERMRALKMFLL